MMTGVKTARVTNNWTNRDKQKVEVTEFDDYKDAGERKKKKLRRSPRIQA